MEIPNLYICFLIFVPFCFDVTEFSKKFSEIIAILSTRGVTQKLCYLAGFSILCTIHFCDFFAKYPNSTKECWFKKKGRIIKDLRGNVETRLIKSEGN